MPHRTITIGFALASACALAAPGEEATFGGAKGDDFGPDLCQRAEGPEWVESLDGRAAEAFEEVQQNLASDGCDGCHFGARVYGSLGNICWNCGTELDMKSLAFRHVAVREVARRCYPEQADALVAILGHSSGHYFFSPDGTDEEIHADVHLFLTGAFENGGSPSDSLNRALFSWIRAGALLPLEAYHSIIADVLRAERL